MTAPFNGTPAAGGGEGFSPLVFGNVAAWFRFGIGITAAANAVSQWADQSGNGRHLKQSTGAAQPTLQSGGSILFDGTSDFLKCDPFTLNQPETLYLLWRQVTWTSPNYLIDGNATNSAASAQVIASPQINLNAGSDAGNNSNFAVNVYAVVAYVVNGAASMVQVNSTAPTTGDAGTGNMGGFTLGARGAGTSGFSNIEVKEVILYSAAHSAATRARVIAYLAGVGGF